MKKTTFTISLFSALLWMLSALPTSAAGTTVLANGGNYFQAVGPASNWHYTMNQGYCGKITSWCSPTYFQWLYVTRTYPVNYGVWNNPTPVDYYSRAYAFIPRINATATVEYGLSYDRVSHSSATVAQSLYYDQWAFLNIGSIRRIARVDLTDSTWYGTTANQIAFDEIKIEN